MDIPTFVCAEEELTLSGGSIFALLGVDSTHHIILGKL